MIPDYSFLLSPINEPVRLITGAFTFIGLFAILKIAWMVIYEIKYYKGAGKDYLYYGKSYYKFQIYKFFKFQWK